MSKIMKYMSIVALALTGALMSSCGTDDDIIENAPQIVGEQTDKKDNIVVVTTTVGLNDNQTKALDIDYDNKVVEKTFAVGDQMAMCYTNTSDDYVKVVSEALKAEDISDDKKSATFTFTLVNPQPDQSVTYCYPASMMTDGGNLNEDALYTQNGTLADVASKDCSWESGSMVGLTLPSVTLENQCAIIAFTLKDDKGTDDKSDDVDITHDITTFVVGFDIFGSFLPQYTINRTPADGPIYVVIHPNPLLKTYSFTASDGYNNYSKTLNNKTYEAGEFYQQGLLMKNEPTLHIENPVKGQVIGSDGLNYNYSNLPAGVTAVAKIVYVSGGNHGLALAMSDEGQMTWMAAKNNAKEHTPAFVGGTWKLATKDEWQSMIDSYGLSGLKTSADGYTGITGYITYYSSTVPDGYDDKAYRFDQRDGMWFFNPKDDVCGVRACLEF